MRRIVLAALLLPLAACHVGADDNDPGIAGSGSGDARSYAVADFTQVKFGGGDDVDVRVGASYSVRAHGSPAALSRLRIGKTGSALQIGRRRGMSFSTGSDKATVVVTLPRLTGASVAGSGTMTVDRVAGDAFAASLAGSGSLAVASLAANRVAVDVSGSGSLRASGTAKTLNVQMAGSGSVDAPGLTAAQASVSVAGSGNVRATVNGPATVNVMGSGDVDLGVRARCTVSKMGSGAVHCGG